ncbi:primosomal protein DnaI [Limosilactobacillus reuteri]|uniref:primosomal protein DnaI n=1 Tax=Limosilactobacillus reuteri TaxID=1598 RepID=UPI001E2F8A09|nr:primosomal protein DnaI [Limosilactobacillus reuteri]MCC4340182.1 primosomal protein DnaI [Limosilactobacillus reuteri]MCC4350542.1 primosomal protein DnaI [Limosilactobacillus reuteri]MCC4361066.1 primosomal protein DnaI [Limosilactobacillus reuteri]MCC4379542.1 primosomal protein DnaI [Limosilactobacillus reuteri]MCC4408039.1 primosomal protein DnaI [Limosilactobacillus reuteri]
MQSLNKTLQGLMRGQNIANNIQQTMKQVYADKDVQTFLNENRDRLSKEAIKRGQSKLYEFFHEKQLIEKGVPTVAPGYSPQLVISAGQIDVTYVPTKQLLERQRQRYIQRLVNSINMPKFIKNASYDDYYLNEDTQTDTRTKAIQAAMDFTDNYQKGEFQPGLYLYGQFGVGKTYLLGAIANELAKSKGVATTMVHFPSFAVEMRNSIKQNNTGEKLDAIKRAPILMLDDIGAGAMTTWVRDDILGVILEYRMQEELPTFFSSNFSMDELQNNHLAINAQGDNEPLKAARIMERIKYLSREIEMEGKNLRDKG